MKSLAFLSTGALALTLTLTGCTSAGQTENTTVTGSATVGSGLFGVTPDLPFSTGSMTRVDSVSDAPAGLQFSPLVNIPYLYDAPVGLGSPAKVSTVTGKPVMSGTRAKSSEQSPISELGDGTQSSSQTNRTAPKLPASSEAVVDRSALVGETAKPALPVSPVPSVPVDELTPGKETPELPSSPSKADEPSAPTVTPEPVEPSVPVEPAVPEVETPEPVEPVLPEPVDPVLPEVEDKGWDAFLDRTLLRGAVLSVSTGARVFEFSLDSNGQLTLLGNFPADSIEGYAKRHGVKLPTEISREESNVSSKTTVQLPEGSLSLIGDGMDAQISEFVGAKINTASIPNGTRLVKHASVLHPAFVLVAVDGFWTLGGAK